ncbi:MAG: hypothetical protein IKH78_04665 [Ruminococcus sp.]|nr:hypothetical protein [Ruminococcus sp.]
MSIIIEEYYKKNNIPLPLLKSKLLKFEKHPDIATEFEYWITNSNYYTEDAVCVEGYTAKKLSEESPYLNGEGAFMMLIELREAPNKALQIISKGIKMK